MSNDTILLVDYDADVLLGYRVFLRAHGYATLTATDGLFAVSQAVTHHPDLILMDLGLPGGEGLRVLDSYRAHPQLAIIPAIVVSGRARRGNRDRAIGHTAQIDSTRTCPTPLTAVELSWMSTRVHRNRTPTKMPPTIKWCGRWRSVGRAPLSVGCRRVSGSRPSGGASASTATNPATIGRRLIVSAHWNADGAPVTHTKISAHPMRPTRSLRPDADGDGPARSFNLIAFER